MLFWIHIFLSFNIRHTLNNDLLQRMHLTKYIFQKIYKDWWFVEVKRRKDVTRRGRDRPTARKARVSTWQVKLDIHYLLTYRNDPLATICTGCLNSCQIWRRTERSWAKRNMQRCDRILLNRYLAREKISRRFVPVLYRKFWASVLFSSLLAALQIFSCGYNEATRGTCFGNLGNNACRLW